MGKKAFDPSAAFKSIVQAEKTTIAPETMTEQKDENKYVIQEDKPVKTGRVGRPAATDEKLVQRGFYITEKQAKAVKMATITGKGKDSSAIIRAAIDLYLSEELKTL